MKCFQLFTSCSSTHTIKQFKKLPMKGTWTYIHFPSLRVVNDTVLINNWIFVNLSPFLNAQLSRRTKFPSLLPSSSREKFTDKRLFTHDSPSQSPAIARPSLSDRLLWLACLFFLIAAVTRAWCLLLNVECQVAALPTTTVLYFCTHIHLIPNYYSGDSLNSYRYVCELRFLIKLNPFMRLNAHYQFTTR